MKDSVLTVCDAHVVAWEGTLWLLITLGGQDSTRTVLQKEKDTPNTPVASCSRLQFPRVQFMLTL